MRIFLLTASIPVGVMVSPETLILLGNSAGYNGTVFYLLIAAAAALSCVCAFTIFSPARGRQNDDEVALLAGFMGTIPGASLVLSARLAMTLLAATSVLVIAGFAFNEIFLYWFPNFGFAFLLLGLILVCNLIGSWAAALQLLLVAGALLSLSVLLINGLLSAPPADIPPPDGALASVGGAAGAVLLFLGFDLIINSGRTNRFLPALAAIVVVMTLFLLWGALSRAYVPAASLAESTLPHLRAARAVMGQEGRLLMGGVVICGAAAAVNGLFLYLGQTVRQLARLGLMPSLRGDTLRRLTSILTAAAIGFFMITGLAGDDNLAVYYRGALLLWLLLLAARCAASAVQPSADRSFSIIGAAAGCTLAIAGIIVWYTAEHSRELALFLLLAYGGGAALVMIWPALGRLFPAVIKHADKEKAP